MRIAARKFRAWHEALATVGCEPLILAMWPAPVSLISKQLYLPQGVCKGGLWSSPHLPDSCTENNSYIGGTHGYHVVLGVWTVRRILAEALHQLVYNGAGQQSPQ